MDTRTFGFRVTRLALETKVAPAKSQWLDHVALEVSFTSCRVIHREAAPFVELQYAQFAEKLRSWAALLRKQIVSARRRAARSRRRA